MNRIYSKEKQIGKRLVPKMGNRTKISDKERQKAADVFGNRCRCLKLADHLHHIKFASQFGKGKYRNLVPLCVECHERIHKDSMHDGFTKSIRSKTYGEYYWCDKWDLWQMGLIKDPCEEQFEEFMIAQENECTIRNDEIEAKKKQDFSDVRLPF